MIVSAGWGILFLAGACTAGIAPTVAFRLWWRKTGGMGGRLKWIVLAWAINLGAWLFSYHALTQATGMYVFSEWYYKLAAIAFTIPLSAVFVTLFFLEHVRPGACASRSRAYERTVKDNHAHTNRLQTCRHRPRSARWSPHLRRTPHWRRPSAILASGFSRLAQSARRL
jgi:hypothetical protein